MVGAEAGGGPLMLDPSSARGLRRVFVRRLDLQARLGVYPAEQEAAQRVFVDLEMLASEGAWAGTVGPDTLERVVDYAAAAEIACHIAAEGHVFLAETLAERIAMALLKHDERVVQVRVTVEKPDILPDAAGVGVTVERRRI
jgi:dihydroneopterin aldolase